ncbi:hypothetical protein [Streptomyces sp. NPDC093261]
MAVSGGSGWKLLVGQERAEHGDHGGDMHVLAGVRPQNHVLCRRFFRLCG